MSTSPPIDSQPNAAQMNIVVIGCGRVGSGVAKALDEAGHNVGVIDRDRSSFARLPSGFEGKRVFGVGFHRAAMIEAGIETAGAMAAVTDDDNTNIVCARIAREFFNVERVVARSYDPRRATVFAKLGVPTIPAAQWATDQVLKMITPDNLSYDWLDSTGKLGLVTRQVPKHWAGKKFSQLGEDSKFRVVAVNRMGTPIVASPETIAQDGDILEIICATDQIATLDERLVVQP